MGFFGLGELCVCGEYIAMTKKKKKKKKKNGTTVLR
jgi:hypothetical protein